MAFKHQREIASEQGIKAWSCGAAWSARRPVKPEVAGSNPVRTARPGHLGRGYGRVAQLAERAPEKREVTGSMPVPTTRESPDHPRYGRPYRLQEDIGGSAAPAHDDQPREHGQGR